MKFPTSSAVLLPIFLLYRITFLSGISLALNDQNDMKMQYEFDDNGEILSSSTSSSSELQVTIVNNYDYPVEVYYDDNNQGILLVSTHEICLVIDGL